MDKHLLVTVSGDKSAMSGVRFVSSFFRDKSRLRVTLFYTAPRPPALWGGELNYESLNEYEVQSRRNELKGKRALEEAMRLLSDMGFPEERINAKLTLRNVSTADDILREGEEGLYDALVLGRRGVTRLEEFLAESVSGQLAFSNAACPLWICRRIDPERSGVLLCLDGSDASLRAADHVGYMVGPLERHEVTMARVLRGAGDEPPETTFMRARGVLMDNGVAEGRIREKVLDDGAAPKALLTEAQEGGYAAVAIGRTGRGRSLLRRMFMGSVGRTLLQELEGVSLWMRS
ncbi:universal stress protein [Desulfocurvus sp. DL9XJH121]